MIDVHNMTGAELKALRLGLGFTQKIAALQLGTSERYLRKQEASLHVATLAARGIRDLVMQRNARDAAHSIARLLEVYGG